jgi:hypothetical protein
MDATLCLTGTIAPHTNMVARADVTQRLEDYKSAIRFYLKNSTLPVAFLENSSYNLSGDPDFAAFNSNERFQLLRYPHHPDVGRGKGFQEFYMLDHFVRDELKTPAMLKVTGRYIVRNIAKLERQIDGPLCIDLHQKMKVAITSVFAIYRELYLDHLADRFTEANDAEGHFIEHVVYNAIAQSDLLKLTRLLPANPQLEGVSGSYGGSLQRNKYKMLLRSAERSLNRGLGIRSFQIEY